MNGACIESNEDFEKPVFSEFVRKYISFENFDEMNDAAVEEYIARLADG